MNKTVYTGFYCTLSQPSQRIPLQSQELANCQPVAAITIQTHSVISSLFPSLLHVMSCASVLSNVPMTLMYLRPRSARQRGPRSQYWLSYYWLMHANVAKCSDHKHDYLLFIFEALDLLLICFEALCPHELVEHPQN